MVCIHSAILECFVVNLTCQLLLTRRGMTKMDGVGIVYEFYIEPL